jgi:peptidoglycan/LPS O-acetylase OafA/YrhL
MAAHIRQFSSLRFLAALWVFISHILLIVERNIPILNKGNLAVDLFVILSGFVITLMVLKRPEPYFAYIFRRGVRIYPLYLLVLGLGMLTQAFYGPVIDASLFGSKTPTNFGERETAVAGHFWEHLALHLTMLHGVIPESVLPLAALAFSGPLWSISLEWQFYLVAPFLIWALDIRQSGRWKVALPVLAVVGVTCALARHYWHGDVPSFLPLRLPLFAVGVLCGLFWARAQEASWTSLAAVCLAVIFALRLSGFSSISSGLWFGVYVVAASNDRVAWLRPINRALDWKPLWWLGERSYGLYVLHMPIVLSTAYFLLPHASSMGQVGFAVSLMASYLIVVAVAAALYRWFEVPLIQWGKRFELHSVAPSITGRPARFELARAMAGSTLVGRLSSPPPQRRAQTFRLAFRLDR